MKVEWKACAHPDQIALGVAARVVGVGVLVGSNWVTPLTPIDGVMGVVRGVPAQGELLPFAAPY